jgi:hypothetical protein
VGSLSRTEVIRISPMEPLLWRIKGDDDAKDNKKRAGSSG